MDTALTPYETRLTESLEETGQKVRCVGEDFMNADTQFAADEAGPALGTVDTKTRYRDRPSNDGTIGDAAAQPRPSDAVGS